MKLGKILLVLSLVLFFQVNYTSTTLAQSSSYYDPDTGITTESRKNPNGSFTITKTDKDGTVISKKTRPPRVKVKPKDKRIIVRNDMVGDAVAVTIVIRYRFYTAEGMKFNNEDQKRWVKVIRWWVDKFNENCGNKIDGVKPMDQVSKRTRLPKRDKKALTPEEAPPSGYTRFATQEAKMEYNLDTYVVGKAHLKRLIGKTNSTRDFHIGVFKDVLAKPQIRRGSGLVPGLFVPQNVIAVIGNTTLRARLHEMGHMFGLEHKKQGDFGVMEKTYKLDVSGVSEAYYGDPDYWGPDWCDKISHHLGIVIKR